MLGKMTISLMRQNHSHRCNAMLGEIIMGLKDQMKHEAGIGSLVERINLLKKLKDVIENYEDEIYDALKKDLDKDYGESYLTEVQIVLNEIKFTVKNLKKWMRPKRVRATLGNFPSKNYIYRDVLGRVLIMAPWNYPFNLTLMPLVGAISGGNAAVIKMSRRSPHTETIVREIIEKTFVQGEVTIVPADSDFRDLMRGKFDLVFFTGSTSVGRDIMAEAAKTLTPVILELGGKSPCYINKTADIKLAARRIAWGKLLNGGQTCIAPDYVLVDEEVEPEFIDALSKEFNKNIAAMGKDKGLVKVINEEAFDRIVSYINGNSSLIGGGYDRDGLSIEPTIIRNVTFDSPVMKEEIFGPVIPVICVKDRAEAETFIKELPTPLALYIFSSNLQEAKAMMKRLRFGGGCINDVVMHIANHHLPFGGVGESGIGCYHGKDNFNAFTREKSVVISSVLFDFPFRYFPYDNRKINFLKKLLF